MKHSIWKIAFIAAIAFFLGLTAAMNADEEDGLDEFSVSGTVREIYPDINRIVIDSIENGLIAISCFPFNKLEAELDDEHDPLDPDAEGIEIDVDDCVTVIYSEKTLLYSGEIVNKFESLTEYCEDCLNNCYEGDLSNESMTEWHRLRPECGQAQEQEREQEQGQDQEQPYEQNQEQVYEQNQEQVYEQNQEQVYEQGQEQGEPPAPPLGHDR